MSQNKDVQDEQSKYCKLYFGKSAFPYRKMSRFELSVIYQGHRVMNILLSTWLWKLDEESLFMALWAQPKW